MQRVTVTRCHAGLDEPDPDRDPARAAGRRLHQPHSCRRLGAGRRGRPVAWPCAARLEPAGVSATISSMKAETIRREALSLPVQERAELAEQLLSSLDALSEAEIEQLWLQEAARRADEMDRGLTKRVAADDVRRQAQALLK